MASDAQACHHRPDMMSGHPPSLQSLSTRLTILTSVGLLVIVLHSAHAHPQSGSDAPWPLGGTIVSSRAAQALEFLDAVTGADLCMTFDLAAPRPELPSLGVAFALVVYALVGGVPELTTLHMRVQA
jgi:hypothetical protein